MFYLIKSEPWCLYIIPAELESFREDLYDVQADNTRILKQEEYVFGITINPWCIELIPAELKDWAEIVQDVRCFHYTFLWREWQLFRRLFSDGRVDHVKWYLTTHSKILTFLG